MTVKAERGAPAGVYNLLVRDSAKGRGQVVIKVIKTGAETTTVAASEGDPRIRKIQQSLIEAGIDRVVVDGQEVSVLVDGLWGGRTETAIRKFLMEQAGVPEVDLPSNKEGLLDLVRSKLGLQ